MNELRVDHDLHCHTVRSVCCHDPAHTAASVLRHAEARGFSAIALTDHVWDEAIPVDEARYRIQNIENSRQNLPLPVSARGVRILFGCEVEYLGGESLSLLPSHYGVFDWIIVAVNHFMPGFSCPAHCNTAADKYKEQLSRLERLARLPLPWGKIGLAHLSYFAPGDGPEGAEYDRAFSECRDRRRRVLAALASLGCGLELNPTVFQNGNDARILAELHEAREAGLRFYCGSDAHSGAALDGIFTLTQQAIRPLGLREADRFVPAALR